MLVASAVLRMVPNVYVVWSPALVGPASPLAKNLRLGRRSLLSLVPFTDPCFDPREVRLPAV